MTDSENVLIMGNYFMDQDSVKGEDHIDLKTDCRNIIIAGNDFGPTADTANTWSKLQIQRGSDHIYTVGNYFHGTGYAWKAYGGTIAQTATDIYAWASIIDGGCSGLTTQDGTGDIGNVYLWNWTVANVDGADEPASLNYRTGAYFDQADLIWLKNSIFLNNDDDDNADAQVHFKESAVTSITFDYNLGYTTGGTANVYVEGSGGTNFESYGTNGTRADPGLDANLIPSTADTYVYDAGVAISSPGSFAVPTIWGTDYSSVYTEGLMIDSDNTTWATSTTLPSVTLIDPSGNHRGAIAPVAP